MVSGDLHPFDNVCGAVLSLRNTQMSRGAVRGFPVTWTFNRDGRLAPKGCRDFNELPKTSDFKANIRKRSRQLWHFALNLAAVVCHSVIVKGGG